MGEGKILKIRLGHEANCSSGMVAMFILFLGAVTHFPLSIITSAIQAKKMPVNAQRNRRDFRYWLIPQLLGLVITAIMISIAVTSGYGILGPLMTALIVGISFAISITAGYILVPRIRYLTCFIVPLIFVGLFFAIVFVIEFLWR